MGVYEEVFEIKKKYIKRVSDDIEKKMVLRLDAEEEEEEEEPKKKGIHGWGTSLPYGIAKGLGISTEGLMPHEVWDKISGETGMSVKAAYEKKAEVGAGKKIEVEKKEEPKKKKEYMTKAKLQKKISDIDDEISGYNEEFKKAISSDPYFSDLDAPSIMEDMEKDPDYWKEDSPEAFAVYEKIKKAKADKAEFQKKLDKKLGKLSGKKGTADPGIPDEKSEEVEKHSVDDDIEGLTKKLHDAEDEVGVAGKELYEALAETPYPELSDFEESYADLPSAWEDLYPDAVEKYKVFKEKQKSANDIKNKIDEMTPKPEKKEESKPSDDEETKKAEAAFEVEKAEKIKDLTAEKKELSNKKKQLKEELEGFDDDTYEGIWKDPVKASDYDSLNIEGKKNYYESKINWLESKFTLTDEEMAKLEEHKANLAKLNMLEAQGKAISDKKKEIKEVEKQIKDKNSALKVIKNSKYVKSAFGPDAYTAERKDNALWAKETEEADKYLREKCGEVWKGASSEEKESIYTYTHSPSQYNEELRHKGYGKSGVSFSGYSGSKADAETAHKRINEMTDIIEKSSYDHDMWLQRGCDYKGMDKFLGVSMSELEDSSQDKLESSLLGKEITEHGFCSAGVAKGKGFGGSVVLNIYAPAGTKMMYAEPFSAYGNCSPDGKWDGEETQLSFSNESECIIQQGTHFRVTKVTRSSPGAKIYIDIEVIGQTPEKFD